MKFLKPKLKPASNPLPKVEPIPLARLLLGYREDLALALRYLYYVEGLSLVPDVEYDAFERKLLVDLPKASLLRKPGSDKAADYPYPVTTLAFYLRAKYSRSFARRKGKYYSPKKK